MEPKPNTGRRAPNGTGGALIVLLAAAPTFVLTGFLLLGILGLVGAGVGPFELLLVAAAAAALTWLFVRRLRAVVRR